MNLNKSDIISTDEDPGLRIESFAIIKVRGVSTGGPKKCSSLTYCNYKTKFKEPSYSNKVC